MAPAARGDGGRPAEAIVVGAGLAGLACAADLAAHGLRVRLLEAADAVGGRVRTDLVQGFRLDRGFQVFNTAYPQVRRRFDLRALRLRPFTPGFLLGGARGDGAAARVRLADPTRQPWQSGDLLAGRLARYPDLLVLAALSARDLLLPAAALRRTRDLPTGVALARAGLSRAAVDAVLRPFLAGVFLEDELETSSRFCHLVWRSMLRGTLCLPSTGIGAVPAQLAERLPPGVLRLESPVAQLTGDGVLLADGTELPAATVVVATEPAEAARLLPGLRVPAGRAVSTFYHAAPRSPLREPTLLVDAGRQLLNTVVLTEVAPTLSGDGRALIASSVLGLRAEEPRVRARLAELYRTDTADWEELAVHRIPAALPARPAPQPLSRSTRFAPGRHVCGDHRATGSVQGALASGARAAREVLADLAAGPTAPRPAGGR
ncbi:FAD-dependent oxidoreductase [Kitasatospora sp. NBC_01287]|uniref:NAD(P)/FAD-dependent oxidoreductase n=1 Tax=Kitasatospora sp. NBC_01287 TaxID=2903573 RepID=UPI00225538E1|nr:NAD(P)/FAD-dependent oxidoreductase [Kitasatospora sp. NBC_01287]MCX4744255.1 FAD-dependent oxidoreductase [Kitasatospora sp. NBC_01287]